MARDIFPVVVVVVVVPVDLHDPIPPLRFQL